MLLPIDSHAIQLLIDLAALTLIAVSVIVWRDRQSEISPALLNNTIFLRLWPPILLLIVLSPFIYRTVSSIAAPIDHTYPESAVVEGIARIIRGAPLYRNFSHPPFAIMPYPPVYYYLTAWTAPFDSSQAVSVMIWGRSVTLCAFLAVLIMLWLFAGRQRLKEAFDATQAAQPINLGPFWATLLFASLPFLLRWAETCRPDMLALLWTLLGMWLINRTPRLERTADQYEFHLFRYWELWLALPFFWLALLTKHSFLAAPATIVLWLLTQRRLQEALLWMITFIFGLTLIVLHLQSISNFHFVKNVLAVTDVPMRLEAFLFVLVRMIRDGVFLLLIGGIALWQFRRTLLRSVMGVYCIIALALAMAASFKLGSSVNYYLEFFAALSVVAAPRISEWIAGRQPSRLLSAHAIMLGLAVLLALNGWTRVERWKRLDARTPRYADIQDRVESSEGAFLSAYGHLALQSEKPALLLDPYLLAKAAAAGNWDKAPLVKMLEDKQIGIIALNFSLEQASLEFQGRSHWPASVLKAAKENYKLTLEQPGLFLYVPR